MKQINICILGSNGLLGSVLSKKLVSPKNKLFLISKKKLKGSKNSFHSINLNNLKKLKYFFALSKPDVVINCVANTNVDECQKFKKKALNLNSQIVKNIVLVLDKINLNPHIVHISTDQVYNQLPNKVNREKDINLSNYYGISKYKGEEVLKDYKKKTILRTNFFGKSIKSKKKSFSELIIESYKNKFFVSVPENIYFNPVNFKTIVKVIKIIIKGKIFGIYNLGSKGRISKYEFAKYLLKSKRCSDKFIKPYASKYQIHKRPLNTVMHSGKLERKINFKLPTIKNSIINSYRN